MTVLICADAEELADRAAAFILSALSAWEGPVTFGLAGGGTPQPTYERLAAADFDWTRVTVWLPDERWVPPDHPDSNARMAREAFVAEVGASFAAPNFGLGDPAVAAAAYAEELQRVFIDRGDGPAPDLVLLGMGDDGHTASLFPGTDALDETARPYVATWVADKATWRLTATFPLLATARKIGFLVSGGGKAGMLKQILDGDAPLPAGRVARAASDVTWLLDTAAAAGLKNRPR